MAKNHVGEFLFWPPLKVMSIEGISDTLMVDNVEKLSPFSLFALYASDNLVHILLQLGTFQAHYTNH